MLAQAAPSHLLPIHLAALQGMSLVPAVTELILAEMLYLQVGPGCTTWVHSLGAVCKGGSSLKSSPSGQPAATCIRGNSPGGQPS